MDLRNRCSQIGQNLRDLGVKPLTLLRVSEDFDIEDLEFPILTDEREDVDRIIVDRCTIDGCEQECELTVVTHHKLRISDGVNRDERG